MANLTCIEHCFFRDARILKLDVHNRLEKQSILDLKIQIFQCLKKRKVHLKWTIREFVLVIYVFQKAGEKTVHRTVSLHHVLDSRAGQLLRPRAGDRPTPHRRGRGHHLENVNKNVNKPLKSQQSAERPCRSSSSVFQAMPSKRFGDQIRPEGHDDHKGHRLHVGAENGLN